MSRGRPQLFPSAKYYSGGVTAVGPFPGGWPAGCVVHYLAHRNWANAAAGLAKAGLGYHLVIDRAGIVHQTQLLSLRTHHAGKAHWRGLSPNQRFASVCLVSWGEVEYKADGNYYAKVGAGILVPAEDVAPRPDNITGLIRYWDTATAAQEATLKFVLRWFTAHGISSEMVCGHDECALPKGRKLDPGGVISLRMSELRQTLTPAGTL